MQYQGAGCMPCLLCLVAVPVEVWRCSVHPLVVLSVLLPCCMKLVSMIAVFELVDWFLKAASGGACCSRNLEPAYLSWLATALLRCVRLHQKICPVLLLPAFV